MRPKELLDREMARLDPAYRIAELESENAALRQQRDQLIEKLSIEQAADGFAMELLGRGIRTPGYLRIDADGHLTD